MKSTAMERIAILFCAVLFISELNGGNVHESTYIYSTADYETSNTATTAMRDRRMSPVRKTISAAFS